jgi:hypothetical protein
MSGARGSPQVRLISSLAMLAVALGGVSYYSVRKTNELLDIGVNAHIQCAIAGTEAERAHGLGTEFGPMLQPLTTAAGTGYTLVAAHPCTALGRAYVQVILQRGQTPISVVLTKRGEQEVFPRMLSALHEGKRDGYSVAGFESRAYLAYVVSALPGPQNKELAGRLEPVIDRFTKL